VTAVSSPHSLRERARRFFFDPAAAEVALEFSSVAITGARVETRGQRAELRALVSEPLSEGAFCPRLEDPGFLGKEEIRDVVKRVLSRLGPAPQARAAIIVPDVVARFRLFAQDEVKAEPGKRDALVAFRMTKLLPFAADDLRVVSAWPRSPAEPVLALGFSSAVLGAYEEVGRAFGLDVGSVETSSMALLRGLSFEGDALLVRHDPRWLALTLIRGGWPVAVRVFDVEIARSPEEVRKEIVSTAVFWRDRLAGQQLEAAFVHASDPWFQTLSGDVKELFGRDPERVKAPPDLVVKGIPTAIERSAAPALALLGAGY
jgi:hypothetical protein